MPRWQITQPPPGLKTRFRYTRPVEKHRRCNCGQPAIAKADVLVGFDVMYIVTLYLCRTCLAYEQDAQDIPPPISITYLS